MTVAIGRVVGGRLNCEPGDVVPVLHVTVSGRRLVGRETAVGDRELGVVPSGLLEIVAAPGGGVREGIGLDLRVGHLDATGAATWRRVLDGHRGARGIHTGRRGLCPWMRPVVGLRRDHIVALHLAGGVKLPDGPINLLGTGNYGDELPAHTGPEGVHGEEVTGVGHGDDRGPEPASDRHRVVTPGDRLGKQGRRPGGERRLGQIDEPKPVLFSASTSALFSVVGHAHPLGLAPGNQRTISTAAGRMSASAGDLARRRGDPVQAPKNRTSTGPDYPASGSPR